MGLSDWENAGLLPFYPRKYPRKGLFIRYPVRQFQKGPEKTSFAFPKSSIPLNSSHPAMMAVSLITSTSISLCGKCPLCRRSSFIRSGV
jgi:hypothetical protein